MSPAENVLVDTSIWIHHFRSRNTRLESLLAQDRVLMHPFVLTELTCGTLPAPRQRTLADLAVLRQPQQASQGEVMDFIERKRLYGQGCGMVDVTLLASVLITPGARLWTRDRNLGSLAARFDIAFATD